MRPASFLTASLLLTASASHAAAAAHVAPSFNEGVWPNTQVPEGCPFPHGKVCVTGSTKPVAACRGFRQEPAAAALCLVPV
jgi:hypothetical protein